MTTSVSTLRKAAVPRTLDTWLWLFMRWSGVLLIPLAWGHVLLQDVIVGVHRIELDYVAWRWSFIGWQLYDIALLGFAFAHGMSGLRYVVFDYVRNKQAQRVLSWLILGAWLAVSAVGGIAIFGSRAANAGLTFTRGDEAVAPGITLANSGVTSLVIVAVVLVAIGVVSLALRRPKK